MCLVERSEGHAFSRNSPRQVQQLPSRGTACHLLGLACCPETRREGLDVRVMLGSTQGGQVERCTEASVAPIVLAG